MSEKVRKNYNFRKETVEKIHLVMEERNMNETSALEFIVDEYFNRSDYIDEAIDRLFERDKKYIERLSVDKIFDRGFPKKIILTSDGIHDYVSDDEMEDIIMGFDAEIAVEKLIDVSLKNGSCDDCTIVILERQE